MASRTATIIALNRYCFNYWESTQWEIHSDQTANRTPKLWLGLGNPSKKIKFVEFEVKLPQYFDQASLILGMSQTDFPPKCIGFLQTKSGHFHLVFVGWRLPLAGKRFPLLKDGLPVGGKGGVPHPAMVGYR